MLALILPLLLSCEWLVARIMEKGEGKRGKEKGKRRESGYT
jgi:hypothetical protein